MQLNRLPVIIFFFAAALLLEGFGDPPPVPVPPDVENALSAALTRRLQTLPAARALAFDLFTPELDTAFATRDGKTAVLWLALRDDGGHLLATEPGLALARLLSDGWQVLLPGDTGWKEALTTLPDGMLPLELSTAPAGVSVDTASINSPLTGYYLPYAAGTSRWLEGSISHFQSIPELGYPSCTADYCRYAYDFTDSGHFPLLASKEGIVKASRDSCSDGDPGCTNYIVLYNAGDQAYQLYLHIAHGTIPDKLTAGTQVRRGQYLGDTDDTGYSTSQHVHFMVTKSIWYGNAGYYWGQSIDVRFADVGINHGIPRTCYEVTHFPIYDGATECLGNKLDPRNAANDWYVSGNVGAYPPAGILSQPAAGATVSSGSNPLMGVTATVSDDVWVTAVSLVAKINDQWVEFGPKVTQPKQPGLYNWEVDLCAAGHLNGPVEVALRAWDYEGNISTALDPRTIQVDQACPPPSSELYPAETLGSTAVRLSWDAVDAGAGLSSFQLQWRSGPDPWNADNILPFSGNQRSTWFAGQPDGTYEFRLRAMDDNGQPEPWPADDAAETSASIPATCVPDTLEPDDASAQASELALGEWVAHNLCPSGNPDWFRVEINAAGNYSIWAASQNGGAAVRLTIFAENGETIVANGEADGVGQDARMAFPLETGSYYVEVEPLLGNLFGTDAVYRLEMSEVEVMYLPLITR
ncbi:MAG: peptidoglycan DD-metalloendopeptidase family protein [Chloroflexi bacterium]|nr:peptidoglycan DD-metalloendopeptidase family protein [Chloroflexota bacterium]